jgi:hypothetical protein
VETSKQQWLINYLITRNFEVDNHSEIASKISGMTASEVVDALKKAEEIRRNLASSGLGQELL